MDYSDNVRICATCNRWGGGREIINSLHLPGHEIVRCDEISGGACDGSHFVTEPGMGIECKKYFRWDAMECSLINKAFRAWNSSSWFARRHFKESKLRDEVDKVVNGIERWCCLRTMSTDIHPAQREIINWLYGWILEPLFRLMYRLKLTTSLPVDLITADDLAEL